jgi:hypothetical protein
MSSPSVTQGSGAPLVSITTTTETAALTSAALPVNAPGAQGVKVSVTVTGATGAGVTSTQLRVYRGSTISGTQIGGTCQEAQGASSFYSMSASVLDTAPGSSQQYTVSVQMVGATGNSTVTYASISAETATATGA